MSAHVHWKGWKSSLKSVPQIQWPKENKVYLSPSWVVLRQMVLFVGISASHSHSDTNFFHHLYGKGWENDIPWTQSATYSYQMHFIIIHPCLFVIFNYLYTADGDWKVTKLMWSSKKTSASDFLSSRGWAVNTLKLTSGSGEKPIISISKSTLPTSTPAPIHSSARAWVLCFHVTEDARSCVRGYTARRLSSTMMKQNAKLWGH